MTVTKSYKPFNLKAIYEINVGSSELTKPFDLTASYDSTAGDSAQYVGHYGFDSSIIENPVATYTQNVGVGGIGSKVVFGLPSLKNKNQTIDHTPVWWQADRNLFTTYGVPKIELWERYVYALGFDTNLFGTANLLGGVKFVNVFGFNSNVIQPPLAINTKADQYANLNNHGIAPPLVSTPNVFPQILYTKQFIATQWGNPLVQFPPRPKGFDASLFGIAWISHSPRYLGTESFKGFETGYHKVFDPTQTIYHADSPKIPGGIFGDIAIRNTRRVIKVQGENYFAPGDWSDVFSNRRTVLAASIKATLFGDTKIHNKTPSFAPAGFDSSVFGQAMIDYRIRRIQVRGIDFSESQRFGKHVLTKTPELKPGSIAPLPFGLPTISNFIRTIYPHGVDHSKFSDKIITWFRYRYLKPKGFVPSVFGPVKIEHNVREIIGRGHDSFGYGRPTVWYRIRSISPASIYREFETKHTIGGTQHVKPKGFDAALFGGRIIPEILVVYPSGFDN